MSPTAVPSSATDRGRAGILLTGVLLAVTLLYILREPLRVHADCAMYLKAGELLLEGKLPYVDFFEVNPPLVMYLHILPVLLARALGVHVATAFLLFVFAFSAASVLVTRRFLLAALSGKDRRLAEWLAAGLAAASLFILLRKAFGQREHLFLLGLVPFLALRHGRWEGGASVRAPCAAAIGLVAGTVACLKPHFVGIVLLAELFRLACARRVRPLWHTETITMTVAGFAYAAHFALLPESVRAAFFGRWLPLIGRGYHVYNLPLAEVLRGPIAWVGALAFLVAFAAPIARDPGAQRLIRTFGIAGLGGSAIYLQQHKGWPYHAIPAIGAFLFVLTAAAARLHAVLADRRRARGKAPRRLARLAAEWVLAAALVVAVGACALLILRVNDPGHLERFVARSVWAQTLAQMTREGDGAIFLSTGVPPAFPALTLMNRRPGSRYLWFFPIPMFYAGVTATGGRFPYRAPEDLVPEEARFLDELGEDIQARRPAVILIQSRGPCQGCPEGFVPLDYLTAVGFIARHLRGYEHLPGEVSRMTIYLRRAPGGG